MESSVGLAKSGLTDSWSLLAQSWYADFVDSLPYHVNEWFFLSFSALQNDAKKVFAHAILGLHMMFVTFINDLDYQSKHMMILLTF